MCHAGLRRRYGETKLNPARISERLESGQDAAYGGVSSRRREATGSRRVTPSCAVNTSFLATSLMMSNTRWATQRNESSARLLSQPFPLQKCLIRNAQSTDSEATASPGRDASGFFSLSMLRARAVLNCLISWVIVGFGLGLRFGIGWGWGLQLGLLSRLGLGLVKS